MSSDEVPNLSIPGMDDPQKHDTPQDFRRRSRILTLVFIAVVVAAVSIIAYLVYTNVSMEQVKEVAEEYWPVVLAPILGWLLGFWAVHNLYHPTASFYGCLDPVTHQFTIVRIPDEMIKYFDQPGNSVQYHTPLSNRYYPVQEMDLQSGMIEYAWPFDSDPQLLFSREESYSKWSKWVLDVAKENTQLRDNPLLLAILLTRNHVGKTLDGIARMLNMDGPDLETKDYSMSDLMDSIHGKEDEGGDNDDDKE